ncbi:MAG: XTP/dITP diphosphatase [Dehalococcoidaceae bacterium]|nr:XTP/dITP diphosphatase [Dehalococcoidaceae bacterium]
MPGKLVLATGNPGKLKELRELLKGVSLELLSPDQVGLSPYIAETGSTYHENAAIKALNLAEKSGILSLADDSGLEVDALDGMPGILSARFGGPGLSDEQRCLLLINKMQHVPHEKRRAQFKCVMALATPEGKIETCEGCCQGIIYSRLSGKNHFGYDPIFFIPELNKTMAELTFDEKNTISHRRRAADKIKDLLQSRYPGGK